MRSSLRFRDLQKVGSVVIYNLIIQMAFISMITKYLCEYLKSVTLREKIFAGINVREFFSDISRKLIFANLALLKISRELIFAN